MVRHRIRVKIYLGNLRDKVTDTPNVLQLEVAYKFIGSFSSVSCLVMA